MDSVTILIDVAHELEAAESRYPKFHSPHEGFAILLEEVEELKAEVFMSPSNRSCKAMRVEAKQVAAMAIRFIKDVT